MPTYKHQTLAPQLDRGCNSVVWRLEVLVESGERKKGEELASSAMRGRTEAARATF
jgi:hypothetical protein